MRANNIANRRRLILPVLLTFFLMFNNLAAESTGPFPPQARSVYLRYPDLPLTNYAGGNLGVLRPTFARSYLVVAYRYMSGKSLNQQEQASALSFWDWRLGTRRVGRHAAEDQGQEVEQASKLWLKARKKVPSVKAIKSINIYGTYNHGIISNYLSCSSDAFVSASKTLQLVIRKYGLSSKAVKDWVVAQDTVFANLANDQHHSGEAGNPNIPAQLSGAVKGNRLFLLKCRAYQIASAYFYAQKYDQSEKLFMKIASDKLSPWHDIAAYLAARSMVRKSSLQFDNQDKKTLLAAEQLLQKQLKKDNNRQMRADILSLLRLVHCRQQKIGDLSDAVLQHSDKDFEKNLSDYSLTLDAMTNYVDQSDLQLSSLPASITKIDLNDWILSFQCCTDAAFKHCIDKWQKTKSLPWLLASLSKAEPKDPQLPKLLVAAGKIGKESPAYLSISYHMVRLQSQIDKREAARKRLQSITSHSGRLSQSAINSFKEEYVRLSTSLAQLIENCLIKPATIATGDSDLPLGYANGHTVSSETIFDNKTVVILNQMLPLASLKSVAERSLLAARGRRDALACVWVRAVLLDDEAVARQVMGPLAAASPTFAPYLASWSAAKSHAERKFIATYFILKFPGLRPYLTYGLPRATAVNEIDTYQENWWTQAKGDPSFYEDYGDPDAHRADKTTRFRGDLPALASPAFLTAAQRKTVVTEMKKLDAVGCAANYLTACVIARAKEKPNDPRLPEALHLAVVSTRYGATDEQTTKFSKEAFQILHKKFPKSSWAAKTKYSF